MSTVQLRPEDLARPASADAVVCTFAVRTGDPPERVLERVTDLLRPTGHTASLRGSSEPGLVRLAAVSDRPDLGALRRLRRAGLDVVRAEWFLLSELGG